MDTSSIFILVETEFGYKMIRANKTVNFDNFNLTQAGPDEFYLERKSDYKQITKESIGKYDFAGSKIIQCLVDNNKIPAKSLNKLLEKIYLLINNKEQIKKNSSLNIDYVQNNIKGWNQISQIGISYPKPKPNMIIYEIIKQLEPTNKKLLLKLELENKQLIKLKI